ncbi:MAG: MFS transporter, partial [Chloroflexi bacterium]|nr:MFS transporter [Chloroflexota bacterium]
MNGTGSSIVEQARPDGHLPLPGFLGRLTPLRSLGYPAFRRAVIAFILVAIASWMERLVVGWYVHQQTQSAFLTAATFAARSAPQVVFGPIAGAVADRFDRRRVLI